MVSLIEVFYAANKKNVKQPHEWFSIFIFVLKPIALMRYFADNQQIKDDVKLRKNVKSSCGICVFL